MFWRSHSKWHSVEWSCGPQRVIMALQFARDEQKHQPGVKPRVERIAPRGPARLPDKPPDELEIVQEVQAAVEEFNKRNRTAVRVAGIRYFADNTSGHREATRKLLNRL